MADPHEKPRELLALYDEAALLFDTVRRAFSVPEAYPLPLHGVDAERADHLLHCAARTLDRIQDLRRAATPGVVVDSGVLVALAVELRYALDELASVAADPRHAATMRRVRQKVIWMGQVVADLGSFGDGPPVRIR